MTPAHISAVLQFITLTGAAFWLIGFFWPALREQLDFLRMSIKRMDAQEKRMDEMTAAMQQVAVDIRKLAAVKDEVNWEDTRTKVDRVYGLADYWIKYAEEYFTDERKMRGMMGVSRVVEGLGRLEKMLAGKG